MKHFPLLIFIVVLLLSPLCSNAFLRLPSDVEFPSTQAEKLIRDLNLFPKKLVNIADRDYLSSSSPDAPKIVEKPLKFSDLIEDPSGVSVQDFAHHAGYFNIEHSQSARMFYFFFESRNSKKDPVVIWLTGGPGCSSELALFYENGPFSIAKNLSLVWNEYGWDKVSNLLYVDQPIGTGFSYSTDKRDIRHDEDGVSNDLYDFLQAFFVKHPEFAKNNFYITGESYAGHYIPAFAARVHRGNKAKEGIHINLKGFAIGNGLTEPGIQYGAYTDYALDMGVISKSDHDRINKVLPVCETAIKLCGTDGTISCMASYLVCNGIFNSIIAHAGGVNVRKLHAFPYLVCLALADMLGLDAGCWNPLAHPSLQYAFGFLPCKYPFTCQTYRPVKTGSCNLKIILSLSVRLKISSIHDVVDISLLI